VSGIGFGFRDINVCCKTVGDLAEGQPTTHATQSVVLRLAIQVISRSDNIVLFIFHKINPFA
jgi:hypothetical protein